MGVYKLLKIKLIKIASFYSIIQEIGGYGRGDYLVTLSDKHIAPGLPQMGWV
jgi:hypothetical protein